VPKNHVIHTRVTDETYHKLSKVCNEIGCNKTDYVISLLDDSFDEDDPAIIEPEPIKKKRPEPRFELVDKPKAEVRIKPEPYITIVDEYGNKWIDGKLQ